AKPVVIENYPQKICCILSNRIMHDQLVQQSLLRVAGNRRTVEDIQEIRHREENLAIGLQVLSDPCFILLFHRHIDERAGVAGEYRGGNHCLTPSRVTNRAKMRPRSSSVISLRMISSASRTESSPAWVFSSKRAARVIPSISC